jgi:hypothetical protein
LPAKEIAMTTMLTLVAAGSGRTEVLEDNLPSGRVLLALAPVIALFAGLIIYSLVDLARAPSVRYLPKPVWALVIVFVSVPFGPIAYLVLGRERHEGPPDAGGADGAPDPELRRHRAV